ncbi:MAG TPA: sigma-54 dependent transcriptional regulator [Planctomycetota bacterium]|nr:sigma-54 dependent transcriptional regulator [Planctomycetota bacterium]
MTFRILVVDDEPTIRAELEEVLQEAGFVTHGAGDGRTAAELAQQQSFDLCLSDIRMPVATGIELLERLAATSPETMVMLMTAHAELDTAIAALRLGAVDYLQKPFRHEELIAKVGRLAEHRRLVLENRNLRRTLDAPRPLVGGSPAMQRVLATVDRVASLPSHVLITGESGTGKDLVARAIHARGSRSKAPFVPINCAAIPEPLLESELFGHVKGAFTGAVEHKEGLLRTAGDGTVFFDELGDMPLALQAKLLRALESREIQPVGSTRRVQMQARVVAATHRDLRAEAQAGRFREDLYYRLAVVEIHVPPLRERREDITALVGHFVERYAREFGRPVHGVAPEALRLLAGHDWRGNVRELSNAIERAVIFANGEQIGALDLPEPVQAAAPRDPESAVDLRLAVADFERAHILRVIEQCDGNKRRAAKLLGLGVTSLYRKLGAPIADADDS